MTLRFHIHIPHIALAIAAVLLVHIGGMAVDPAGMHAKVPDGTSHAHSMRAGHSPDHGMPAHDGHGPADPGQGHDLTLLTALMCIDTEGVPSQSRVPLEPVVFAAVLPEPVRLEVRPSTEMVRGWEPPTLGARDIRVLLQVFLN